MPASEAFFVERIHVLGPPGFRDAVREAARREGQSDSEFIRSAIRDRLRRGGVEAASAGASRPAPGSGVHQAGS